MNTASTESMISDEDLDWLENILLNRVDESEYNVDQDEGIILLSELDGYFTAIVSAPTFIPPSQWLPAIWGDFEPEWNSQADFQRAFSIMIEIMNSIVYSLLDEPEDYAPLFQEGMHDGKMHVIVDEWCLGYIRGMGLCADDWNIEKEPMLSLLMPIVMFGSESLFEMLDSLEQTELDALKQQIAPNVKQIHAYWLERREDAISVDETYSMAAKAIPEYSNEYLQTLSETDLIQLLLEDEDRVPRNLIDECASRGDKMLEALAPMANPVDDQDQETPGRWWIRLHAIMILGLMPGEKAGMLLLPFIDYMRKDELGELADWLAGYWPALTRNKPPAVIDKLRELCEDRQNDWYTRSCLSEAVIDYARQQGEAALDKALDWCAALVADENEDWEFRLSSANTLLDFPRARYRQLLEQMTVLQKGMETYFDKKDVNKAYDAKKDRPEWENEREPWDFYQPQAIKARQQRWSEESAWGSEDEMGFEDDLFDEPDNHFYQGMQQPFERETPKVGRNDPCPCGSGKKFKKCCLH